MCQCQKCQCQMWASFQTVLLAKTGRPCQTFTSYWSKMVIERKLLGKVYETVWYSAFLSDKAEMQYLLETDGKAFKKPITLLSMQKQRFLVSLHILSYARNKSTITSKN